jgi:hypothetical protein
MSRSSRPQPGAAWRFAATLIGTLCVGIAPACGAAAAAGTDRSGAVTIAAPGADSPGEAKSSGGIAHGGDELQLGAPGKAPKAARSLFRCWQDGRMIYEGRGYAALPKSQVAAELKSGDSTAGTVQVLDLYQGLCVLELPK